MAEIMLGGRYTDSEGRVYTVLGLVGSVIKVGYVDGTTVLFSRIEHLRALREAEKQGVIDRRHQKHLAFVGDYEVDMFTAGFLAARGYLYAKMPPEYEHTFIEDHVKMTEQRPDDEHYNLTAGANEWQALSTYVECPYNDDLDFGGVEFIEQPNRRWRACANRLFWALLLMGFRLGNRQDIELIRSRLHSNYDAFDRGVATGRAA